MRIPVGFTVDGVKASQMLPRVHKILTVLESLLEEELLTSSALAARVKFPLSGGILQEADLQNYHEKVDGKLLWGSQKSIARLRSLLAETEVTNENQ